MKKIFALAMVLVSMAAGMTSCSNGEADDVMAPKPTKQSYTQIRITSETTGGVTKTTVSKTQNGETTTETTNKSITDYVIN